MNMRASQSVWSRFSGIDFSLRSFSLLAITATALAQNPPANPVPAVGTSGRVSLGIGTVEVIPALKVTLATRGAEQAIELDRVQ
ncbi:MAG: hypothetical protein ACOYMU_06760, partial [Phycisphaerales bacterium]